MTKPSVAMRARGGAPPATAGFVSNADGQLVARQANAITITIAVYVAGGLYEQDPSTGQYQKYYRLGGRMVAEREVPTGGTSSTTGTLHYLHQDHLGSTTLQSTSGGAYEGHQFRGPFGQPWASGGTLATDLQYTGQRSFEGGVAPMGSLLDYGSRSYSPILGRFLSPDTIVPGAGNPQHLNRYAYVGNNPLKYTDPTGHAAACEEINDCGNDWDAARYPTGYSTSDRSDNPCRDYNDCSNDWPDGQPMEFGNKCLFAGPFCIDFRPPTAATPTPKPSGEDQGEEKRRQRELDRQTQAPDPNEMQVQLQARKGGITIGDLSFSANIAVYTMEGVTGAMIIGSAIFLVEEYLPRKYLTAAYALINGRIVRRLDDRIAGGGVQGYDQLIGPLAPQNEINPNAGKNELVWRIDIKAQRGWNLKYW